MADRPLRPATDRRLGGPLPRQQANPPRARPRSEAEATFSIRPERLMGYPVLIRVSPSYPGTKGGLLTCYSPVRRCPQNPKVLVLARLACVKRAASVRPEPGSNSP